MVNLQPLLLERKSKLTL